MKPPRPVRAGRAFAFGAAGGSPLAIVAVWGLSLAGIEVPMEVAAALGSLAGAAIAHFGHGRRGTL